MKLNPNCFSPSTNVSIAFYKSEWDSDINISIPTDEICKETNYRKEILDDMILSSKADELYIPMELQLQMKDFYNKIYSDSCPTETSENIKEFIMYINNFFYTVVKKYGSHTSVMGYVKKQLNLIYGKFFSWAIQAHEIYIKTTMDCRPADEDMWYFTLKSLRYSMERLLDTDNSRIASVLIFNIAKEVDLQINETDLYSLLLVVSLNNQLSTNFAQNNILNYCKNLNSGNIDALKMIDEISGVEDGGFKSQVIDWTKRRITENYRKDKINVEKNSSVLCVGDNILPDDMSIYQLIIELDKLSEDMIKDYIGNNQTINFSILDNKIGYMRYNKVPMCKFMYRNNQTRLLVSIDETCFLIFTLYGSNDIFGISISSGRGGERKLVRIKPANEKEYELSIGNNLWQR